MMSYRDYYPSPDRMRSMENGAEELLLWMEDLFQGGMLRLEKDPSTLGRMAERMVDYKNGSIARRLRIMAEHVERDPDWPGYVLDECAELFLLAKALCNRQLSDEHRLDAFQAAGYTIRKDRLPEPKMYNAQVMDVRFETYESLRARKTHLTVDKAPWFALVLEFAYGNSRFEQYWEPGNWYDLEASFYPSASPVRLKVMEQKALKKKPDDVSQRHCDNWKEAAAWTWERMGKNPWQDEWAFIIRSIQPAVTENGDWTLVDRKGEMPESLRLSMEQTVLWQLLAFSKSEPFSAFCVAFPDRIEIKNVARDGEQWIPISS